MTIYERIKASSWQTITDKMKQEESDRFGEYLPLCCECHQQYATRIALYDWGGYDGAEFYYLCEDCFLSIYGGVGNEG